MQGEERNQSKFYLSLFGWKANLFECKSLQKGIARHLTTT